MKSHSKRILSLILALIMSLTLAPAALAANYFSDVSSSHWAYDAIQKAAESGYVSGYPDGTFRPNGTITNAEFVVMVARAIYGEYYTSDIVPRYKDGAWYTPAMSFITESLNASPMTKVRFSDQNTWGTTANQPIIRADVAAMRSIFFPGDGSPSMGDLEKFSDCGQLTEAERYCIRSCVGMNELGGYPDGTFRPYGELTRAEACVVVDRMQRVWHGETLPSLTGSSSQPTTPTQPQQPEAAGAGKLANSKDATPENVQTILDEIKQKYPAGTLWGDHKVHPNTNYNADTKDSIEFLTIVSRFKTEENLTTSIKYACGGWACMVSDTIFGKNAPGREVTDLSQVRLGDVMLYFNTNGKLRHVAIIARTGGSREVTNSITGVKSTAWIIETCDGNVNGGYVYWPEETEGEVYTYNEYLGTRFRIFTRYPE